MREGEGCPGDCDGVAAAHDGGWQGKVEAMEGYIAAESFQGTKDGYCFKMGKCGLG